MHLQYNYLYIINLVPLPIRQLPTGFVVCIVLTCTIEGPKKLHSEQNSVTTKQPTVNSDQLVNI